MYFLRIFPYPKYVKPTLMRQQFTPLILCLFLSLLLVKQVSAGSLKKTAYSMETLVKTGDLQALQYPENLTEHSKKTIETSTNFSTSSDVFFNDARQSFKTDNSVISEFSYNFDKPALINLSPISEKILTNSFQYSDNPKTLFYQGLFYGFIYC